MRGLRSADTSVTVATDMTTGVIDRFRSLPVAGVGVLVGHVVATVLRNLVSTLVVLGVAIAIGFRPTAGPLEWLASSGCWCSSCRRSVGSPRRSGSSRGPPRGRGVRLHRDVPALREQRVRAAELDAGLSARDRREPAVTPVIETLRGLMTGTPIGSSAWIAVIWCVGGVALGAGGAAWLFGRRCGSLTCRSLPTFAPYPVQPPRLPCPRPIRSACRRELPGTHRSRQHARRGRRATDRQDKGTDGQAPGGEQAQRRRRRQRGGRADRRAPAAASVRRAVVRGRRPARRARPHPRRGHDERAGRRSGLRVSWCTTTAPTRTCCDCSPNSVSPPRIPRCR